VPKSRFVKSGSIKEPGLHQPSKTYSWRLLTTSPPALMESLGGTQFLFVLMLRLSALKKTEVGCFVWIEGCWQWRRAERDGLVVLAERLHLQKKRPYRQQHSYLTDQVEIWLRSRVHTTWKTRASCSTEVVSSKKQAAHCHLIITAVCALRNLKRSIIYQWTRAKS